MLVLGKIGDAKTVPLLIEIAKDASMDRGSKCNAVCSLGSMRAADAKPLMESLLSDESVKVNAAIALSQITGRDILWSLKDTEAPTGLAIQGSSWPLLPIWYSVPIISSQPSE